jgi:enoyl-CoA hydratase/carnithine racemase
MSKINKPVFGYVKGLVGGTSAYLLNMLSTPFGDKYTHMVLHDIDNHFVPICGGSYLLSRLKGELGAYLALTGDKVDANDMVGTGFIYALVRRDFS